jgi:uroporphyrinogen-III synthase
MRSRVLIARDAERAGELVRLLEAEGLEAIAEPVTRTVFLTPDDVPALEAFDWLIFTSANGVRGFGNVFKANVLPPGLRIAVVGPGTAEESSKCLRDPDYVARQNDAGSLARELLEEDPELPRRAVLWPCAAKTSPDLDAALKNAGADVIAWPVYVTEAIPNVELSEQLVKLWPWGVALFAAPSAVAAFAQAWPAPWNFPCVAIGQVTAKALTKEGAKSVRVSNSPRAVDLRNAVLEILKLRENNEFKP